MTTSEWLSRAEDDLAAARVLMETGHPSAAVRAPTGVNSAFGRYVVKEGGANPDAGRTLNRLLDRRTLADYEVESMTQADAHAAIDSARLVVDAVETWLAQEH